MIRFDWDPSKAFANIGKHGVSFEEASTVLGDPLALYFDDMVDPTRSVVVGMSNRHRILVVVHVECAKVVRLISARLATAHERRRYEEGT